MSTVTNGKFVLGVAAGVALVYVYMHMAAKRAAKASS